MGEVEGGVDKKAKQKREDNLLISVANIKEVA
jgi:hypothetical protein